MQTDSSAMRISKAWCEDRSNVATCAPIIATIRSSQPNALQQQPSKASLELLLQTLLQNIRTAMMRRRPCDAAAVKWTRRQASGVRHLGTFDIAEVYGHRPKTAEVWWLSPYEFVANWAVTMARVPTTQREWELEQRSSWDVSLTAAGLKLIQKQTDPDKKLHLQPGTHYCLAVQTTPGRICFEDRNGNSTAPTPLLSGTSASPLLPAL